MKECQNPIHAFFLKRPVAICHFFVKKFAKQAGAELCQAQASLPIKVLTLEKLLV